MAICKVTTEHHPLSRICQGRNKLTDRNCYLIRACTGFVQDIQVEPLSTVLKIAHRNAHRWAAIEAESPAIIHACVYAA